LLIIREKIVQNIFFSFSVLKILSFFAKRYIFFGFFFSFFADHEKYTHKKIEHQVQGTDKGGSEQQQQRSIPYKIYFLKDTQKTYKNCTKRIEFFREKKSGNFFKDFSFVCLRGYYTFFSYTLDYTSTHSRNSF